MLLLNLIKFLLKRFYGLDLVINQKEGFLFVQPSPEMEVNLDEIPDLGVIKETFADRGYFGKVTVVYAAYKPSEVGVVDAYGRTPVVFKPDYLFGKEHPQFNFLVWHVQAKYLKPVSEDNNERG